MYNFIMKSKESNKSLSNYAYVFEYISFILAIFLGVFIIVNGSFLIKNMVEYNNVIIDNQDVLNEIYMSSSIVSYSWAMIFLVFGILLSVLGIISFWNRQKISIVIAPFVVTIGFIIYFFVFQEVIIGNVEKNYLLDSNIIWINSLGGILNKYTALDITTITIAFIYSTYFFIFYFFLYDIITENIDQGKKEEQFIENNSTDNLESKGD